MATRHLSARVTLCLAAAAGLAAHAQGGTWTRLNRNAPGGVQLMLLLSDGTVMAAASGGGAFNGWYKLTPDINGSYQNGSWSTRASMHDTRLYFSSQVLKDGRVFVAGGEYGTGGARGEVYDPTTNTWTQMPVPATVLDEAAGNLFYDSNSEIIADGKVIITPVLPRTSGVSVLFDPSTNTWSNGPRLFRGGYQDEATWAKLPDQSIITIDPFGQLSERYIPSLNRWVNDSSVPVAMYDSFGSELGGAAYMPNGKVLFLGATGHTALYTPSGANSAGLWTAGPDMPNGGGTPDAPCAMMVNGNVLCAISPAPTSADHFPSPTRFYEYSPTTNTFISQLAPGGGGTDNRPTYTCMMLALPTGQILYSHLGSDVYLYTPTGTPTPAGKPTITSVTPNPDGSFHLVGLGLNGISEGASYGDDAQMNSNYPLVRAHSGINTYYCRTFNWSYTGIASGSTPVSTEYTLPPNLPAGPYTIQVVANGFVSDAFDPTCTAAQVALGPAPATGCEGSSIMFSVNATGTAPGFAWYRGTQALNDGGNVSGSHTSTLTLSAITSADGAAAYHCVVSNACGSATSADAALTVLPAYSVACGGPGCDADVNQDGNVDQGDVDYLVNVIAGGANPVGVDADFNHDGNLDQGDIDAIVNVVAGGACP
ncbi:MAG: kelch repeat-containing protein [Phycisphaerales bacterium]|jgi:hypothetical protein